MDDWKEKQERYRNEVIESLTKLCKKLSKKYNFRETLVYANIGAIGHELEYDRYIPSDEKLETLLEKKKRIEDYRTTLFHELNDIESDICIRKREFVIESKILGNLEWDVKIDEYKYASYDSFKIILLAKEEGLRKYQKELRYLFGDYCRKSTLYEFSNGEELKGNYSYDHDSFKIVVDLDVAPLEEYIKALEALGIDANIEDSMKRVEEKENELINYKKILKYFKDKSK